MNKIILFYKYIAISCPKQLRIQQWTLCRQLNLKGRIWLAEEGINGTLGGTCENIDKYINAMKEDERFADIDFKENFFEGTVFPKLKVKVRPEVVRLGIDPKVLTSADGGTHLSPQQTHELIAHNTDDLIILDTRNGFEAKIGKFTNAIVPDINHFREFPEYLERNAEQFKNKHVLMYCTGGIRCERASALLKSKNIAKQVYQIAGGIHRYVEQYPNGYFRGKNYVFDGRIAVRVNDDILSECHICKRSCDEYTNCTNVQCNKQFIACGACITRMNNTCGEQCKHLVTQQQVATRTVTAKMVDDRQQK